MKQTAEPVVSEFKPSGKLSKRLRRLLPVLIIIVVVIIVIVVVIVIINKYHNDHKISVGVCSQSLIQQASNDFSVDKVKQLSSVTTKIQGISNYEHDPNCMYIMTVYYINKYDVSKAESSLDQFNKVYTNKLNTVLLGHASVTQLRQTVAFLKKSTQALSNNASALSPPPIKPKTSTKK